MKLRIYPSIGIARLGNGPAKKDDVVFTPEIPWENLYNENLEFYTKDGALKKQAQRFYIYECDKDGVPTKKLDTNNCKVEWTVEVANKKPFWYDFNNSLDLSLKTKNQNLSPNFYKNEIAPGISTSRRNPNVLNQTLINSGDLNYRKELVNSPKAVSVSNSHKNQIIGGQFPFPLENETDSKIASAMKTTSKDVNLGAIEYDEGTLIFYPGDGVSAALNPSDLNTDFADNSNWYDDICDGRITARVTIGDTIYELNNAESAAWIATAPPDYAPQIQPLATMYDLVSGIHIDSHKADFSSIFPVFYRLYRMQWVNLSDFLSPSFRETIDQIIEKGEFKLLFNNSEEAKPLREKIFNLFRDPLYNYNNEPIIPSKSITDITNIGSGNEEIKYPFYPGDGINYPGSPAQWFAIPPILYDELKKWRDGNFKPLEKDFKNMQDTGEYYREQYLEAAKDPSKSALLMTKAVLETLYGGGFHPGVELTWPMRHKEMYKENTLVYPEVTHNNSLFGLREIRINTASKKEQSQIFYNDFGFQMDSDDVNDSIKPDNSKHWLWKTTPGDLTKWMGIPWQSDAGSCQKVFLDSQYPIPAWWAANLPVDVLTEESLVAMRNTKLTPNTVEYLYANRSPWLMTTDTGYVGYHAEGGYLNGLISMVYKWKNIGVVAARKANVDGVPKTVYVAAESKNVKNKTAVFLGKAYPNKKVTLPPPNIFYSNTKEMVWIPSGKDAYLSSNPDGTGDVFVDDVLELQINGKSILNVDFSDGCSGKITPTSPIEITPFLEKYNSSFVNIEINYIDKCGGAESSSKFYLVFK